MDNLLPELQNIVYKKVYKSYLKQLNIEIIEYLQKKPFAFDWINNKIKFYCRQCGEHEYVTRNKVSLFMVDKDGDVVASQPICSGCRYTD